MAGDVADLYRITSELIPGVGEPGEIVRSETFVVMASCNKWVSLPEGCWSEDAMCPPQGAGMKIAVLGGLGLQGRAAIADLVASAGVEEVICVDTAAGRRCPARRPGRS